MRALFEPECVAVIGASADPAKLGGQVLIALANGGFRGRVYPVNPTRREVFGLECRPDLAELPERPDLAVIALPAAKVVEAVEDCVRAGVGAAIIFSSGFAETGPGGAELQARIGRLARQHDLAVCGPNCLGVISAPGRLMANFLVLWRPDESALENFVGFISQSGSMCAQLYALIDGRGLGFSRFISSGNEADLDFADYLAYLSQDPHTQVIGGYLEGVRDLDKLGRAAEAAKSAGKPVMIIKVGRQPLTARAAARHTGSRAGSNEAYQVLFDETGVIAMDSLEEMAAGLSILASGKPLRGDRVAILTPFGGAGVLVADRCLALGLELSQLSPATRRELDRLLPAYASSLNPVDMGPQLMSDPNLVRRCAELILADEEVDSLILCTWVLPEAVDDQLADLIALSRGADKLVLNLIWGPPGVSRRAAGRLHQNLVPAELATEPALRALAGLAWRRRRLNH